MESKKAMDEFYQTGNNSAVQQNQYEVYSTSLISDAPFVSVCSTDSLQHSISFDGAVMMNGKTRIGYACEIRAMLDGQTGFTYLSSETHSPYSVCYGKSACGKTIAYRLRWINENGETGPWSEVLTIIIQ